MEAERLHDRVSVPAPHNAAMQIQFQYISVDPRTATAVSPIVIKNTTGMNFASVTWSCQFKDRDGYRTGGGNIVVHYVVNNKLTQDAAYLYQNGNVQVTIDCADTEVLSRDNERLYQVGRAWRQWPISTANWSYDPRRIVGSADLNEDQNDD
jgi:hypothetical protein